MIHLEQVKEQLLLTMAQNYNKCGYAVSGGNPKRKNLSASRGRPITIIIQPMMQIMNNSVSSKKVLRCIQEHYVQSNQ